MSATNQTDDEPTSEPGYTGITSILPRADMQQALLWITLAAIALSAFIEPVVAQNITQEEACNNMLMTTVDNATFVVALAGLPVGTLFAGFRMLKAARAVDSNDQKEAKKGIKNAIVFGVGASVITGFYQLLTIVTPVPSC